MMLINFSLARKQSGAVLVISLVMLLLLTIIGLSSIETTLIEEKMSYNLRDANISFQSAEGALVIAENEIETAPNYASMIAKQYVHDTAIDVSAPLTWSSTTSKCTSSPCGKDPRYLIIKTSLVSTVYTFDIYARGVGASGQGIVILKSTYNKSY